MSRIDDNSVDIIIADPPYNIGKDFGNNKDNMLLQDYLKWTECWLNEARRIIKPMGTIYIYGFSETLARISCLIDIDKQKWLIWHYTNKNVPSLNFWQRSHEAIIACWKSDKPLFNRDYVREPYTKNFLKNSAGKVRPGTFGRFSRKGKKTIYNAHKNGALPRDVIKVSTLAGGASLKERIMYCKTCKCVVEPQKRHRHENCDIVMHPTQKPYAVTDKLIKAAKPKTQKFTALIPFAGSGSECLATIKNGGNFIAFEINPDYCTLAKKMLANELQEPETTSYDTQDLEGYFVFG
ncbi:MAG: site-specific DNA-methyltransferase [Endomicrobium sp.]|nr:site-specific DNA-methyltransferase [Endomicrobium sp.]